MAYRCLECGNIFEEGEQARWSESRGEFWGNPCEEEMVGCPLCRGDYEKTIQCSICGSEHLSEELDGGVCEECIDTYRYDVNMCFRLGEKSKENVEINGFLASMYSASEIEELIWQDLMNTQKITAVDCTPFIESDSTWFAENLAKEVKKDENAKG